MNYFDTYDKKKCNGCSLCENACPQKCITMEADYAGFLYPVVDQNRCINCKKCERICSNVDIDYYEIGSAYAMVNLNADDLQVSSSGGMFIGLAKYVISQGGVVCGVRYDTKLNAIFDFAESIEDCYKFCGSKYVRAEINGMYSRLIDYLDSGILVLFGGTSCQANAVKKLTKKYDNIIICDIICHANPSPVVYKMYLKALEDKRKCAILDISFRTKKNGWYNRTPLITFSNGEKKYDVVYYKAFIQELISRDSCSECMFARNNRISDITIGDLWGGDEILTNKQYYTCDKGLSLVLVNSEKGAKYFSKIKDSFDLEEVDYEKALSYNHNSNVEDHKYRKKFFEKLKKGKITEKNIYRTLQKYTQPPFIMRTKIFLGKIKRRILNIP